MPAIRPTVQLAAGSLTAEIVPSLGAGLARFDLMRDGRRVEIFRGSPAGTDDPNQLGLYVLVPWSNRVSGLGFIFQGEFYPLAKNYPDEPCPIHGHGWLSSWDIIFQDSQCVRLEQQAGGPDPYRYSAELEYTLNIGELIIRLSATNRGPVSLPFGLGFHPWFPRTKATTLMAIAKSVWLEGPHHLPSRQVEIAIHPEWNFASLQPLPTGWINNAFTGWDGRATIRWEDRSVALDIEADSSLGYYLLYSPSNDANFFCFEPISHSVDAHNLLPGPEAHGLVVLTPGQTLSAACRFRVYEI